MSANITDKITDTRNAARPNSARVSTGRSAGGTTLACDNLTGWPDTTRSKVHFVTYTIDSSSNPVAGTQLDCYGIVSGNNITSFTVVDGTDTGNLVNDVVEMIPTAAWGQDLADALMAQHTRTGAHGAITATSVTNSGNGSVGGNLTVAGTAAVTGATTLTGTITANGAIAGFTPDKNSNPYKFRASRNAAANTGNNAFAVVAYDTEQYDTGNNHSSGVFTAPVNGFYHFAWGITVSNSGTTQTTLASLFKNGTEYSDGLRSVTTNVTIGSTGADTIQLTAGDTVDVRAFCTSTQPLSVGDTIKNFFSGFLVSAT